MEPPSWHKDHESSSPELDVQHQSLPYQVFFELYNTWGMHCIDIEKNHEKIQLR